MKRFIKGLVSSLLCFIVAFTNAQIISWVNTGAAADWYTASNWSPSTSSGAWLPTNTALFNNTGSATTAGINASISSLSVAAISITSSRTRVLAIGNSSATNSTLQLNGATIGGFSNVVLSVNCPGPSNALTLQNGIGAGTGNLDIVLGNAVDNVFLTGGNNGTITINSAITGTGKNLSLRGTGSTGGTVTLNAANTYTGLTTIAARTRRLILNKPGGNTLPPANDIAIYDGALIVNTDQTVRNIGLLGFGSGITIADGATLTVTGTFTKNMGGVSFGPLGTGKLVYTSGASLVYSSGATIGNEFTAVYGPTNVTFNGPITLPFTRTIGGTITISGPLLLNGNDITAGAVTGTGKIVTNGAGKLNITNVGTTPVVFPVAGSLSTYNPVTISNGQGLTYGVRVDNSITPAGVINPNNCVNRSWAVTPLGPLSASPVNVAFYYTGADVNPGFNLANPLVDAGRFTTSWQGVVACPQIIPVTAAVALMLPGSTNTFVIGNTGSVQ